MSSSIPCLGVLFSAIFFLGACGTEVTAQGEQPSMPASATATEAAPGDASAVQEHTAGVDAEAETAPTSDAGNGSAPNPGTFHILSVTRTGAGSGRIFSEPAGIDCGLSCFYSFPEGETITLRVVPRPGNVFAGWGGACSGTGSCVVTLGQGTSIEARFEPAQGTELWSRFYSAEALWAGNHPGLAAAGEHIAVEAASGNLVIAGQAAWFDGTSLVMTPGLARLDASGVVVSTSRVRESEFPAPARATSLTLDASGNAYVGATCEAASCEASVEQYTGAGICSFALPEQRHAVVDAAGALVTASASTVSHWGAGSSALWTVSLTDVDIVELAVDGQGGVLVLGRPTSSGTLPNGAPAFKTAEVIRLRAQDGSQAWRVSVPGVRLGTTVDLLPAALAVTASGEVYVAGHTEGPGGTRASLVKLDASGAEQWRQEFDFLNTQAKLAGVAVTPSGGVVVTGSVGRLVEVRGQPHPSQLIYVAAFGSDSATPTWELETHPSNLSVGLDVSVRGSYAWVTGVHGAATPISQLFVAKYQL